MTVQDIIDSANSLIGDTSTDRVTAAERLEAATEATAWLLEELGNEHMTDRTTIEYIPTVTWYKMDSMTPYLLTAGQLRFKDEDERGDFTRVEPRELVSFGRNKHAYCIERYNGDSYLGIIVPDGPLSAHTDLIPLNQYDGLTYTGTNATNITGEKEAIRFDMDSTGVGSTGISTTSDSIDLTRFQGCGSFVFEIEIPDIADVNSISLKFGDDLSTDYWLGTVTSGANGSSLVSGVNTIVISWDDLIQVGTPDVSDITKWQWLMNHETDKSVIENIKLSDLRIAEKVELDFKYIFYRVGKNVAGSEITEFTNTTDVPFFADRYPQYRFAVGHKTASVLFRFMQLYDQVVFESNEAESALKRYRKNFSGERDMSNSAFKPYGINLRRKIVRRR